MFLSASVICSKSWIKWAQSDNWKIRFYQANALNWLQSEMIFPISVARCLDYFSICGHLQQWKFTLKHKNCQSRYKRLPKYEINHTKNAPNTSNILPKWRNFAKSGHTVSNQLIVLSLLLTLILYVHFSLPFWFSLIYELIII